ncbi:hypothetical protein [Cupriavidus necator]
MSTTITRLKSLASVTAAVLADAIREGHMEVSDAQRMARGEVPLAAADDVYVSRTRMTKSDPKATNRAKEKARRKARALARRK